MKYLNIFILIFVLTIAGCDNNRGNDNPSIPPDINSNTRYASIRYITLSDSKIDFGNHVTGNISTRSITFTNSIKNYPIKFSLNKLPQSIAIDKSSTCDKDNSVIYPNDECSFTFLLSESKIGNYFDNITFRDKYDQSHNISVTADVIADISPIAIDKYYHSFGEISLSSTDAARTEFNITNNLDRSISITIEKPNSSLFFITPFSSCNVGLNTLKARASCTIHLYFSPSSTNTKTSVYNDNVILKIDGSDTPISITAIDKKRYTDINSLNLSKEIIDYGVVELGDFKIASVRIRNSANDKHLKFSLPDIPDGFSYEPSSTCGVSFTTLPLNQSCDFFLRYEPQDDNNSSRNRTDKVELRLWVDQSHKPLILTGIAIDKKILDISPKQIVLDNININKKTTTFLTVKNISDSNKNIAITLPTRFTLINSSDNNKLLGSGESYKIGVQFTPTTIDNRFVAEIKINTDDYYHIIPVSAYITDDNYTINTQYAPKTSSGQKIVIYDNEIIYYDPLEDNTDRVYIYSLPLNAWERVAGSTLPDNLTSSALSIFNDMLYLSGGIDSDNLLYNSLYAFDLIRRSWSSVVVKDNTLPMPEKRKDHTTTVLDGKLYLFGGTNSSNNTLNDFWVFDFNNAANSWSKLNLSTVIDNTNNSSILLSDNRSLYLITDKNIYRHTPNVDADWVNIYTLSEPLTELVASTLSGSDIYILGKRPDSKIVLYRLNLIGTTIKLDELDMNNLQLDSNSSVHMISYISNSVYIFQMYDDKHIDSVYRLNRYDDTFDKINLFGRPELSERYTSTLIGDIIYYMTEFRDLFSYDTSQKEFRYILHSSSCNNITDNFTLVSSSDKIYQIDGSKNICIFDPVTEQWVAKTIENGTDVSDNFSTAIEPVNGIVYLYGGNNSTNAKSGKLWRYILDENLGWEMVKDFDTYKLSSHKMIFDKNTLYIAGGNMDNGQNGKLLSIDLSTLNIQEKIADDRLKMSETFSISTNLLGDIYIIYKKDSSNIILRYNIESGGLEDLGKSLNGGGLDFSSGSASAEYRNSSLYIYNELLGRMSKIILN